MTTFAESLYYKSGRLAVYYLLLYLKEAAGLTKMLMPAYHCPSMLDSCNWAGIDVVLYKLDPALRPDIADLRQKVEKFRPEAMTIVHYFGMPTPAEKIRGLPELRELILLEDAAHVFPGEFLHAAVYEPVGDWLLESPRKHLPIFDGGIVRSRGFLGDTRHITSHPAPLLDEARAAKDAIERAKGCLANAWKKPPQTSASEPVLPSRTVPETPDGTPADYVDGRFQPSGRDAMTVVSRVLFHVMPRQRRAVRRRTNYQSLQLMSGKLDAVIPLYPELPERMIPFAYPLLLEDPEQRYKALRDAGIRVFRWEGLMPGDCSISARFEHDLVHFTLDEPNDVFCRQKIPIIERILSQ